MTRRPIEIDDLYSIRLVADPNISPDGLRVVWVVTEVDRDCDGYKSNIWGADLDGDRTAYRLTTGNGCLLYTSPSPRDRTRSRMPSSA